MSMLGSLSRCQILSPHIQILQQGRNPQHWINQAADPVAKRQLHQVRTNRLRKRPIICHANANPTRKSQQSATNSFGFCLGPACYIWQPRQIIPLLFKIPCRVCTSSQAVAVYCARQKSQSRSQVPGSVCMQRAANFERSPAYSKRGWLCAPLCFGEAGFTCHR